ncbi:MAG: PD-(D/E)XK nuclease family protein [bacterium]|nr:PD-(D/E)XK nuclease family protein [bacterium]
MGIIKTYPLWISHSSIRDFLACPRAYFLHNVYKDPRTNHKITIMNPSLALGQMVHEVLESLSLLKSEDRFKESLISKYNEIWVKVSGELGGFKSEKEEAAYRKRGEVMIQRVMDYPGSLLNKALKLTSPDPNFSLPHYFISVEDNIILCGKVDWLEYLPEDDGIHIIDFKTGKNDEDMDSLQLPIYSLLVKNRQKRKLKKVSYWYLERDDQPIEQVLPDLDEVYKKVLELGLRIKELRKLGEYICPKNGCFACRSLEAIINKQAKYVSSNSYQDIYIIN